MSKIVLESEPIGKPQVVECLKFNNEYFEIGDIIHITQGMGYSDYQGRIKRFDSKERCGVYEKILILDISKQYQSNEGFIYFSDIRTIKKVEIDNLCDNTK